MPNYEGTTGNDFSHSDSRFPFGTYRQANMVGNDTMNGLAGSDVLQGYSGVDTINGGDDGDFLYGDMRPQAVASGFTLDPSDGGDFINGQGGDDFLAGNAGHDTLDGGANNDTLEGGAGNDTLIGGDGADIARYSGQRSQYTITPTATGWQIAGPDGTDTLTSVEQAAFSDVTEALGGGDDYADAIGDTSAAVGLVEVNASNTGSLEVLGDRDLFSINLAAGKRYQIDLRGTVSGGGTLTDPYLRLFDQSGALLAENDDSGTLDSLLVFTATTTATHYVQAGGFIDERTGTYTLEVMATGGSVTYQGTSGNDSSHNDPRFPARSHQTANMGGNDSMDGHGGNDLLQGYGGADTIHGGDGLDVIYGDTRHGPLIDANDLGDFLYGGAGTDQLHGGAGNDTLDGGIDNDSLFGGDGDDVLSGGAGDDNLSPGDGTSDILKGGEGDDSYSLGSLQGGLVQFVEAAGEGFDNITASDTLGVAANVERILQQYEQGFVTGDAGPNWIETSLGGGGFFNGAGGDDVFVARGAGTEMTGGAGRDSFVQVTHAHNTILDFQVGLDRIVVDDWLGRLPTPGTLAQAGLALVFADPNGVSALAPTLIYFNGELWFDDGNGSQTDIASISFSGPNANPDASSFAVGGVLTGGTGNQTFNVEFAGIEVSGGADRDTVRSSVNFHLGSDVEALELLGSADLYGWGNGFDNTLTGNSGANVLEGGGGADVMFGNAGADSVYGGSGTDDLNGGTGNDLLVGGSGNDFISGGTDNDTAAFSSARSSVTLVAFGGTTAVLNAADHETDRLILVEQLQFTDTVVASSAIGRFGAMDYLASYDGLIQVLGANEQAGFEHYVAHGFFEGRAQDAFQGFDYLASHTGLIQAFGANEAAAAHHFVTHGFSEGRSRDTFDGFQYVASYDGLIQAFGPNETLAAQHFVTFGFHEGRPADSFDGFQYLASYTGLIQALGASEAAAAQHFVTHGFGEGRSRDAFDGFQYLASYTDLLQAIGANEAAAAQHFVTYGFGEGRSSDAFDGFQYLASHGDLISAFGANEATAAHHFVAHGFWEGRAPDTFDAAQYLQNYVDLRAAFGTDQFAATLHFIHYGYFEGRTDNIL